MGDSDNKRFVLVVDDELNLRKAMQYILEHQGYRVDSASDGNEALVKIKQNPPDLVLLDLQAPTCSGYDVCQSVRADQALNRVKILIFSALGKDIAVEKAMALGADGYVLKPFCTADLIDTVGKYCGQGEIQNA